MGLTYYAPTDPADAIATLASSPAAEVAILAGGTDLLFDMDAGRVAPRKLLSLRKLPWRWVRWEGEGLRIGSTLPLSRLEVDSRLRTAFPAFFKALRAVGSAALRHRATVGGNLGRAAPASDLLPVLLSYDAQVRLLGTEGRREIDLNEFLVASRRTTLHPSELIESVLLPEPRPSEYLWQRVRPANDISQVGVATAFSPSRSQWSIAIGGVLPRPIRVPGAEAALRSARPTDREIRKAASEAALRAPFVTDKRATEAYRRRLLQTLTERAIRSVVASNPPKPGSSG